MLFNLVIPGWETVNVRREMFGERHVPDNRQIGQLIRQTDSGLLTMIRDYVFCRCLILQLRRDAVVAESNYEISKTLRLQRAAP
jgi:hypothetical protein